MLTRYETLACDMQLACEFVCVECIFAKFNLYMMLCVYVGFI